MKKPTEKNSRKIVKEFAKETSFFGLSLIVKSEKKFFWFLLLLLFVGLAFYVNISAIMDYLRFDVISSTHVHQIVPMALPMITICNMNTYLSFEVLELEKMLLDCQVGHTKCNVSDFSEKFRISTYHCFSLNDGVNKSIIESSRKGYLNGISLKLYAGLPNETALYLNGFLVFINNQTEFPLVEQAVQVSGGFYTRLMVIFQTNIR